MSGKNDRPPELGDKVKKRMALVHPMLNTVNFLFIQTIYRDPPHRKYLPVNHLSPRGYSS